MSTIVASAMDSPNCGMMIGTCGIKLFFEQSASFLSNQLRARPMRAPKIWMIRNRGVFRVDPDRRGVEQMKSFTGHTRYDFGGRAAPRKRFADGEQTPGACDRCEHGVGIER